MSPLVSLLLFIDLQALRLTLCLSGLQIVRMQTLRVSAKSVSVLTPSLTAALVTRLQARFSSRCWDESRLFILFLTHETDCELLADCETRRATCTKQKCTAPGSVSNGEDCTDTSGKALTPCCCTQLTRSNICSPATSPNT